ncbi:MAG: ABC transporter substrate-binding protein [Hyphomicrobiales bacterium]|nr:ABC transporter substrate-binding protein [Hyphomicrobiales bacterium]
MSKRILNRRRVLAGAGSAGTLLLSGSILSKPAVAQGAGPDVGITANSIKIGLSAGITGPIAFASRQFSGYMQKQFERINTAGGINGRKIELSVLDDGGKGDVALQNAQRLLQQQQVFAMSTIGTATTAGILDFLTKQNVPLLFPGAYNTELVSPTRANTFALYQPYEGQIAALVKWAYGKLGSGSAVIVRANPPSFDLSAKSSAAAVQAGGGQVVSTLNTTYNQPEWTSIVIRVKEASPDYIIVLTTASDMGRLWQELSQQNAQPKKAMLGISPLADQAFLDTAGGNVPDNKIYAALPATVVQTAPEAQSARDLIPNERMGIFGLEGAASASVIAEALRRLGEAPTRAKLVELLHDRFEPYKLPYMDTVKSAPNHLMVQSVGVSTVKGGVFVPATSEFVL